MQALVVALIVYVVATCGICAAAIIRGDRDARRAATGFLVTAAATQLATLLGPHWRGPEFGVMVVDACYFAFLTALAVRSTRFWPLWAAASQLNGTLTHLAAMIGPPLPMKLYASTQPAWAIPILIAIMVGIRREPTPAAGQRPANRVLGPRPISPG